MRVFFVALLVALVGACSDKGEPGSCYRQPDNACIEYGASMGGAGKRLCSSFKWTPGAQSCPKENRLGTCIKEKGKVNELVYGGPPNNFTVPVAKNTCEFKGGVFLPASADGGR